MMEKQYILSVDQSTQGTKALLFDRQGRLLMRRDQSHRQLIDAQGWVSHDPEEIYQNTVKVLRQLVMDACISHKEIAALGISNQRETSLAWNRTTGASLAPAVVWQCSRAAEICEGLQSHGGQVEALSGMPLSPYFPAAKYAWLLRNVSEAAALAETGELCLGTIDSWLVFRLTQGGLHRTDYSNASRTQLFNLETGAFDETLCSIFGIPMGTLPEICDSDGFYGETDLEGFLETPIPIHGVLGDSHAALFGQGCLQPGMIKATYGTGSSIMMNVGDAPVRSKHGIVSSVGFKIGGRLCYVLEGNLNYTGAVISWLKNDMKLIEMDRETEALAYVANPADRTCIVPAFTGLGAPYWDSEARAAVIGMSRTTGRAEFVKAALSCIAQQITDVVQAMEMDAGLPVQMLRVDGGPTRNRFLMQLQSDLAGVQVQVPDAEELSGIGAAYAAGMALGFYDEQVFAGIERSAYQPEMSPETRELLRGDWKRAVKQVLTKEAE